ncbi:hypothetical protein [Amycolatopsis sp. CA-126428]|nr:hypothetical protein [Amycolatopsis sp. CA-126428]
MQRLRCASWAVPWIGGAVTDADNDVSGTPTAKPAVQIPVGLVPQVRT